MKKQSIKEILRTISFFYWIMFLFSITFIVGAALFVSNVGPITAYDPQFNSIIITVLFFLLIIHAPISYMLPQRIIAKIDKTLTLPEKLQAYRTAMLIRYFTMNSASFIVAVAFLMTGITNIVYLQLIVMLFFIIYKPTPFKIAMDLDLEESEKQQLME